MASKNRFGTTSDMVIQNLTIDGKTRAIAIDADGLYLTSPEQIGRITADTNRYGTPRSHFIKLIEASGIDAEKLFMDHRHLLDKQAATQTQNKKINPIKASKRG